MTVTVDVPVFFDGDKVSKSALLVEDYESLAVV
jgi:hypothetical protein